MEKKNPLCCFFNKESPVDAKVTHACALCWPVVLLHVLLCTTYAVASGVAPTQAHMMTPRPLFSLPFNLESLLNCSFPFSAQRCRTLLFIYFCCPRCCANRAHTSCVAQIETSGLPVSLVTYTWARAVALESHLSRRNTHMHNADKGATDANDTHIADKHCQCAFCPVQTLAFRLCLYLRRCLNWCRCLALVSDFIKCVLHSDWTGFHVFDLECVNVFGCG